MATVDDLTAAIQTVDGLVDQLIVRAQAEDFQPAVDALAALAAKIDGALNPPAAPEG